MSSRSPSIEIADEQPALPGSSLTKSAAAMPKGKPLAQAAFQRTVGLRPKLPLDETRTSPARDGVTRLRGAFLVEIGRIQPDPKQPRKEFPEEELANLTASIV